MKVAFAAIINPIVWEIPLSLTRTCARNIPYNHPSTNYTVVAFIIASKKSTGRFVIATISSNAMITVASFLLAVAEVLATMSVKSRDQFIYKYFLRRDGGSADPLAVLKHSKNSKLRLQLAHIETTLEIVFIFLSPLIIGYISVSNMADGGLAPTATDMIAGALIQYFMEVAVDFINVSYLTVYANTAYLEYAPLHHKHYLWTMGCIALFTAAYSMNASISNSLSRIAPIANGTCLTATCGHETDWVWTMPCVTASNSTFNACL